jgi:hypothetical protein
MYGLLRIGGDIQDDQNVSVHLMITVQKHAKTQGIRAIPTQLMI